MVDYAGMGFVEAVGELARQIGMPVPENTSTISIQKFSEQRLQTANVEKILQIAHEFYRQQLHTSELAKNYLIKRGLTGEIAARYGLGYAPAGWNNLQRAFPDYSPQHLNEAGLVILKNNDQTPLAKSYDRFRERIIFPIRSIKGQIIGFGGRILESGEPKYLNSPETILFQKGNELYGLFEARQAIREAGYILVVEGYMDVIALAQAGFSQTVATLGTACTAAHLQKLLRLTDQIIFSFDGDGAGRRAAKKGI